MPTEVRSAIKWVARHLTSWVEAQIYFRSPETRREVMLAKLPLLREEVRCITTFGDCTDTTVRRECFNKSKAIEFHSFKLHLPALRVMVRLRTLPHSAAPSRVGDAQPAWTMPLACAIQRPLPQRLTG